MRRLRWFLLRRLLGKNDRVVNDPAGWPEAQDVTYLNMGYVGEAYLGRLKRRHWIGQWPRQTGKLAATREMAAQAKEQGHEVWGWDPKAGMEHEPEWLFPKTQEPTMETGGPAGAAFTPMMVRPTNDATTLAFNTMRSELLKLAQQYDQWAEGNDHDAVKATYASGLTLRKIATEQRNMAGQLRQIARGRQ